MPTIYTKVSEDMNNVIEEMTEKQERSKGDIIRDLLEKSLDYDELAEKTERLENETEHLRGVKNGIKIIEKEANNPINVNDLADKVVERIKEIVQENSESVNPELEKANPHEISMDSIKGHWKECKSCLLGCWNVFDDANFECAGCGFPYPFTKEEIEKFDFKCPKCGSHEYDEKEEGFLKDYGEEEED